MKRARTRLAAAVLLAFSSVILTGLSRAPAITAEAGQDADAGDVWTLVFNMATKPMAHDDRTIPCGAGVLKSALMDVSAGRGLAGRC